ncbi:hypothetical protein [Streptosporangium saharense]|uniref:Uncharacterized protein n=1 Tax=Streptosporangium saharense TaxID=1706840 RepID=A0A7W7VKL4_9ACTN|nr:hypothetical protein [Streptosporangium saharense]MBB4913801.1 hypothetical protein [Streptosporangium saharense]
MKIRRLHTALLTAALGTTVLAAPTAATAQTGSQIMWVGPFKTLKECNEYRDYTLAHPPYRFVDPCEYNTDLPRFGFYFLMGY